MKITLELPENLMAAFLNGVIWSPNGLNMVSYSLDTDDLRDGNTIKLPREAKE